MVSDGQARKEFKCLWRRTVRILWIHTVHAPVTLAGPVRCAAPCQAAPPWLARSVPRPALSRSGRRAVAAARWALGVAPGRTTSYCRRDRSHDFARTSLRPSACCPHCLHSTALHPDHVLDGTFVGSASGGGGGASSVLACAPRPRALAAPRIPRRIHQIWGLFASSKWALPQGVNITNPSQLGSHGFPLQTADMQR